MIKYEYFLTLHNKFSWSISYLANVIYFRLFSPYFQGPTTNKKKYTYHTYFAKKREKCISNNKKCVNGVVYNKKQC